MNTISTAAMAANANDNGSYHSAVILPSYICITVDTAISDAAMLPHSGGVGWPGLVIKSDAFIFSSLWFGYRPVSLLGVRL